MSTVMNEQYLSWQHSPVVRPVVREQSVRQLLFEDAGRIDLSGAGAASLPSALPAPPFALPFVFDQLDEPDPPPPSATGAPMHSALTDSALIGSGT